VVVRVKNEVTIVEKMREELLVVVVKMIQNVVFVVAVVVEAELVVVQLRVLLSTNSKQVVHPFLFVLLLNRMKQRTSTSHNGREFDKYLKQQKQQQKQYVRVMN
jgi:hypothetical protein